ncbi:hypothetical protein CA85_36330 [Allorhodopirellula solitaria]|uniref:Uncharacterized protein n=1 Tax=Allorhodopirellula solitaria TaxID=2527987 RepID=A0A5C5XQC8_9BACT|nr:hypothetical protein CA85_36330 [Allorhodopirellula solitaria]
MNHRCREPQPQCDQNRPRRPSRRDDRMNRRKIRPMRSALNSFRFSSQRRGAEHAEVKSRTHQHWPLRSLRLCDRNPHPRHPDEESYQSTSRVPEGHSTLFSEPMLASLNRRPMTAESMSCQLSRTTSTPLINLSSRRQWSRVNANPVLMAAEVRVAGGNLVFIHKTGSPVSLSDRNLRFVIRSRCSIHPAPMRACPA